MSGPVGITESTLEEIKQRIDLGELIASYGVDVRHAGSSLKACCPFHHEKTPSFNINASKGFYHCFGCGESGDAIKFVQKFEGLSFVEAVKKLAAKIGIEIQERADPNAGRTKRLFALMAELAAFYRRCLLMTREATIAREYLKKRDLGEGTCEKWTVGYAPEGAATILKWAEKYKYEPRELEEAGVIIAPKRPGDNAYHRFSGRLMFTIRDKQGRVVAFSGRLLRENKKMGKYVNSPETPIFKKSNVLFGFDRAQGAIARSPRHEVIACEGQIDCMRLHEAGFETAVASQGTAFTEEHAKMLKRVAESAVLMYDDDAAGHKATIKVAGMLLAMEMPVRVVGLPDGDDPDSFLCKHKPEDLQRLIDGAESIVSFQCRAERAKEANPKSIDAVKRITKAVLATIARCPSPVLRAVMTEEASKLLSIPQAALDEELANAMSAEHQRQILAPPERQQRADTQAEGEFDVEVDDVDFEPGPEVTGAVPDSPECDRDASSEIRGMNAHAAIPPPSREMALMEFLMANEYDKAIAPTIAEMTYPAAVSHDFAKRFVATWLEESEADEDRFAAFAESLEPGERAWFDSVLLGAGKPQASMLSPAEIASDFVRILWQAELTRRRGALPADGDDATIMRRMDLTSKIKRVRQAPWETVKKIVEEEIRI